MVNKIKSLERLTNRSVELAAELIRTMDQDQKQVQPAISQVRHMAVLVFQTASKLLVQVLKI